jgi:Glycosyltransferase family 9 (heptosyltransferase)
MGYGDQIIGTGLAKGAAARGKRIAFGDGKEIKWDHHSEEIFKNNPNIAPPGSENANDLEWVDFYRGNRLYNRISGDGKRWNWNYKFKCIPGEFYFTEKEVNRASHYGSGFIVMEPSPPHWKACAVNKTWPFVNFWKMAKRLKRQGHDVRQFKYPGYKQIEFCEQIKTQTFREACAILARAKLYIGPEGGMHHAAAALGIPAVVLFGGFIPPAVTGYDSHTNFTGGARACGSLKMCVHCIKAMQAITLGEVEAAAQKYLLAGISAA